MLNRKIACFIILLSVVFLNNNNVSAQSGGLFKKTQDYYTSFGIGGGSSHYFGDLSPYSKFYYALYSNVRWNGTLNYEYNLNERFGARFAGSYIQIFGNDMTYGGSIADSKLKRQRIRNLHFRNDMAEFTLTGLYTFIPLENRRNKNQPLQWSPYIGGGIGILAHNPKARLPIQDPDGKIISEVNSKGKMHVMEFAPLKPMNNEGQDAGVVKTYSSIVPVFPLVLGIKTKINNNLILSLEGSLRIPLTDYLDDVGSNPYVNMNMSYRANEDYDAYTGKPRVQQFRDAVGSTDEIFPITSAQDYLDMSKPRGGKHLDSYIVTQIKLNYIINSGVKCPTPKY